MTTYEKLAELTEQAATIRDRLRSSPAANVKQCLRELAAVQSEIGQVIDDDDTLNVALFLRDEVTIDDPMTFDGLESLIERLSEQV